MTTNSEIISDALREIGVIEQGGVASASQASEALRTLNRMMSVWAVNGIDLGYFSQTDTNDDCPVPEWAEFAVINLLAAALASNYGQTVTMELAGKASSAFDQVQREAVKHNMQEMSMSKLQGPFGSYDIGTDRLV